MIACTLLAGDFNVIADFVCVFLRQKVVVERPSWTYLLHRLPRMPSTFVAFISRNCLDAFEAQNKVMMEDKRDAGWTCKYGREREYAQYKTDKNLAESVTSLHDMICTIKQAAYLNMQHRQLKLIGIDSDSISFSSLSTLPGFIENAASSNLTATQTREPEAQSFGLSPLRHRPQEGAMSGIATVTKTGSGLPKPKPAAPRGPKGDGPPGRKPAPRLRQPAQAHDHQPKG